MADSAKYATKALDRLEKLMNAKLKKQVQEGLTIAFDKLSCKGVASQIRKGKDITGNVEYGIKHCVHPKIGPRVNPTTGEFFPQTKQGRVLEHRFIETVDKILESGGFRKTNPKLLVQIRKGDRQFQKKMKTRYGGK